MWEAARINTKEHGEVIVLFRNRSIIRTLLGLGKASDCVKKSSSILWVLDSYIRNIQEMNLCEVLAKQTRFRVFWILHIVESLLIVNF